MSEPVRLSLVEAQVEPSAFVPMRRDRVADPTSPSAPLPDDYARGYADGQQVASDIFATEHAAMTALLAAAQALQPEPSEELAAMIAATVETLVTQVVGAVPVDRVWLNGRVQRAVALVNDADNARTLWLNPDDIALVDGVDVRLTPIADAALPRGSLRIDCSTGWIEDGRSFYLDALRTELGLGDVR